MIYMYLENQGYAQLLVLHMTDNWYLRCDLDENGDACIYLNVHGNEYEICCGSEFSQHHPRLDADTVIVYYNALVREVYRCIKANGGGYIDLEAIKEQVLPNFWAVWKQFGFVTGDIPGREVVCTEL